MPFETASKANMTRKDGLLWPRRSLVTVERSSPMSRAKAASVRPSFAINSARVMGLRVSHAR